MVIMEEILFLLIFAFITSEAPPENPGWLIPGDNADIQFLYHPMICKAYGRALQAADLEETVRSYSPNQWFLCHARQCYQHVQSTPAASTVNIYDGYSTDYLTEQMWYGREVAADLKVYIDDSEAYTYTQKNRLAWMEKEVLRRVAIYDALRTTRYTSDYSCKRSAIADMYKLMGNDYFKGYLPPIMPVEYGQEIDEAP